jgi:hypothetical protein
MTDLILFKNKEQVDKEKKEKEKEREKNKKRRKTSIMLNNLSAVKKDIETGEVTSLIIIVNTPSGLRYATVTTEGELVIVGMLEKVKSLLLK